MSNENLRVMLVDDDADTRSIMNYLLNSINPNLNITEAENGHAAVKAYLDGRFDLIFLDVDMPEVNGWDTLEFINDLEELQKQDAKVVMVTGRSTDADRERANKLGAYDFVSKPFDTEEMIALMEGLIEEKKSMSS